MRRLIVGVGLPVVVVVLCTALGWFALGQPDLETSADWAGVLSFPATYLALWLTIRQIVRPGPFMPPVEWGLTLGQREQARPATSPTPNPRPDPSTFTRWFRSHRRLRGFKAAVGVVVLALAGTLAGATDTGHAVASFANLQHNVSTILGHARGQFSPPQANEAKPKSSPDPARARVTTAATRPATPRATPTVSEKGATLAAYNPDIFGAGPLANRPVIGTLKFPHGGICPCGEYSQIKLKAEVTNSSNSPIEAALGGTSAKAPAGPYLVFTVARSTVWKAEPGARVSAVRYPVEVTQPDGGRSDAVFVPANPDPFYRRISASTYTWKTYWSTQTVAPGHTYRDPTLHHADLVFTTPAGEAFTLVAVVWVTERGVLVGPVSDLGANLGSF